MLGCVILDPSLCNLSNNVCSFYVIRNAAHSQVTLKILPSLHLRI